MSELLPGTEVQARGLRWEVVMTQPMGPQTFVRLRGLDEAVKGSEVDLLSPLERLTPLATDIQPQKAVPLSNWLVYHQAFLLEQALGSEAFLSVQPGRIRPEPYQLVPVMRALQMSRPRLLLCDGVGLGKTIQAGLVVTELMARRLAHRLLVVSPAGPLLDQWHMEFRERFGLRMETVDRALLEEKRRANERGANPFDDIPLGLASIDFLKQERIVDLLERTSYDVIIIDESHHCFDLGASREREDTLRRRLAEVLARKSDCLLLLTATPDDGTDRSFPSLIELLDPSLVDGKGQLRGVGYRKHVIRRLKRHLGDKFKQRIVTPCPVPVSKDENKHFIELHRALLDLLGPELKKAFRTRRYSDVLAYIALLKRSVSTVAALRETLQTVADRYSRMITETAESGESRRQRIRSLRECQKRMEQFGSLSQEEEEERHILEVEETASLLRDLQNESKRESHKLKRFASVADALEEITALADAAIDEDPKIAMLVEQIKSIRSDEPRANVLVYTEYSDSQETVAAALDKAGLAKVLTLSGKDPDRTRKEVTDRFSSQDNLILVSTDASAEGLNLHQKCHHLIHLELPFNPNRLEQRNGRIDRYGQTFEPQIRYLYLRGTFEERILIRLIAKYEKQRSRLTFLPNTLGGITLSTDAGAQRLLKGLAEEEDTLFSGHEEKFNFDEPEDDDLSSEATREIVEEIERSLKGYEQAAKTRSWLAEAGINAEERLFDEAETAREKGLQGAGVDIVAFVRRAVTLDGGRVRDLDGNVMEVNLPATWTHGLQELPGYDPETRRLLLTSDINVTRDSEGREVGFLGRAHPLVSRALQRVRNIQFGERISQIQDRRASVVAADVKDPQLLFTFLGRIMSGIGREYERVLAVRMSRKKVERRYENTEDWLTLADMDKAVRTDGVWKRDFEDWGLEARKQAIAEAEKIFEPVAGEYVKGRQTALKREEDEHRAWLQQRANEITGEDVAKGEQATLFDESDGGNKTPAWRTKSNPQERLSGFATEKANPMALRSEAETVLRIYRERMKDLEARRDLSPPEIVPLGLLMLVPGGAS